jgi:hypothetical protein
VQYKDIPVCPSPTAIEEITTKMKALNMPYKIGQLVNGCMSIETSTPTSTQTGPSQLECGTLKDLGTGTISYSCEKINQSCPPVNSSLESACVSYGGNPFRTTYNGCPYITCDLGGGFSKDSDKSVALLEKPIYECPDTRTLLTFAENCEDQGLEARLKKDNSCPRVECVGKMEERNDVCPNQPTVEEQREIKDSCPGTIREKYDSNGCPQMVCVENEGGEGSLSCSKEIPSEAVKRCAEDNGNMTALTNEKGCITFSYCTQTNEGGKVVVVKEDVGSEQMERILGKLLPLQNEIEETKVRATALATYYDKKESPRGHELRAASKQLDSLLGELDSIVALINDNVDGGLEAEKAAVIATQLVGIKTTLNNALNLMLHVETNPTFCADGDFECFRAGLQNCKVGTNVRFSGEKGEYGARINSLDAGGCAFTIEQQGKGETKTMACVHPEYEKGRLDLEIMQTICTGLFDELKEETSVEETTPENEITITASPKISAGSTYSFTKYPGCRETFSPGKGILMVCPMATKNAIQPHTPISGLLGLVNILGGK